MEDNTSHNKKNPDFHQQLSATDSQDPLARENQQHRAVAEYRTAAIREGGVEEEMALDRSHATEALRQHHKVCTQVEPTGEEEAREAKKHLAQRP